MKKILGIFLLGVASIILLLKPGFCSEKFSGINPEQPILPGGVIYYNEQLKKSNRVEWLDYSRYIYLGAENKNIRIKYKGRNDATMQEEENDQIVIPIDENNQAILSANQASADLPPNKLIITVVNTDNAIKVELYPVP